MVSRGDNFARAALLSVAKRVSVDPDESAQERKGMKSDSSTVYDWARQKCFKARDRPQCQDEKRQRLQKRDEETDYETEC